MHLLLDFIFFVYNFSDQFLFHRSQKIFLTCHRYDCCFRCNFINGNDFNTYYTFDTPVSQTQFIFFAISEDRMENSTNWDGKYHLTFYGWDFEFYCLRLTINPVRKEVQFPNFRVFFPYRGRILCLFFQGW